MDHDTGYSLPLDKSFWDYLFDEAKTWGLATYEQDWLDRQYENLMYVVTWLNYCHAHFYP